MTFHVGFIGTGNIVRSQHIPNLSALPEVKLAAFCDVDLSSAEECAGKHGGNAYGDYRQMLDREKLDAVFLCTPHTIRLEPIRRIVERKIALFCEKPPEFNGSAAKEAAACIENSKILNTVGFMYRWLKIAEKAKQLIAKRPVSVCQITGCWSVLYWNMSRLYLQDKSGGPVLEQGIHLMTSPAIC